MSSFEWLRHKILAGLHVALRAPLSDDAGLHVALRAPLSDDAGLHVALRAPLSDGGWTTRLTTLWAS